LQRGGAAKNDQNVCGGAAKNDQNVCGGAAKNDQIVDLSNCQALMAQIDKCKQERRNKTNDTRRVQYPNAKRNTATINAAVFTISAEVCGDCLR